MPSIVCSAQASYKKLAGLLELTDSHLQWTKAGDKAPLVKVPHAEFACKSSHTSLGATLTTAATYVSSHLQSTQSGHSPCRCAS